jgi:hypothetical protein
VEVAKTIYIRKDEEFIGEIHASSLVIEEGGYQGQRRPDTPREGHAI